MADSNIPYMRAYGNITKTLHAIQKAQTLDRFTTDFLETKLSLKGGSARPVIPFPKKTGFLAEARRLARIIEPTSKQDIFYLAGNIV
jgi:hypothetical protein